MHIFSGLYKGRNIQTPKGIKTRPTSGRLRESLFNICQAYENPRFLDLFAGSGAMGLEALSRGASFSTFIDNSRESIRCIQSNIKTLGAETHTEVFYGDVFELLMKLTKQKNPYDIIYADPPYSQIINDGEESLSYSERILKIVDEYSEFLLKPHGSLFLEDASNALPKARSLKHLKLKNSRQMGRSSLQYYVL